MKKLSILFCLLIGFAFSFQNAKAQDWLLISGNPTPENLNDIYFATPYTGIAVGDRSNIIRTTDAGATWSKVDFPLDSRHLRRVRFSNASNGIAVGDTGLVLKTTDGGLTWAPLTGLNASANYYAIMYHGQNVVIAGEIPAFQAQPTPVAFYSSNGGAAFSACTVPNGVFLLSVASNGTKTMAGGKNGRLYTSSNMGQTWTLESGVSTSLTANLENIEILANGGVYASNSLGTGHVRRRDDFNNYMVGTSLGLGRTAIKGDTVIGVRSNMFGFHHLSAGALTNVRLPDALGVNTFLACASAAGGAVTIIVCQNGRILRTVDGTVWTHVNPSTSWTYGKCIFTDSRRGFTIGYRNNSGLTGFGYILTTNDGGRTWEPLPQYFGAYNNPISHYWADSVTGWTVTQQGDAAYTTNRGNSWTRVTQTEFASMNRIKFLNRQIGYMVGGFGAIYKTTNGGVSWTAQTSGTTQTLDDISIVNQNVAYASGVGETILKTTNGGSTWQQVYSSNRTHRLTTISFVNENVGWTGSNILMKTTDGGATWRDQINFALSGTFSFYTTAYDLKAIDENNAVAVGWGYTMRTTNGGTTWILNNKVTNQRVFGLGFVNTAGGISAGRQGVPDQGDQVLNTGKVVATGDGGLALMATNLPTGLETTKPSMLKAEQLPLYPNPSEQLLIRIPNGENISGQLRVIDHSGRLVLTEDIEGEKLIQSAANLVKGVYHLQLITPSQSYQATWVKW